MRAMRVLVVDDDPAMTQLIAEQLAVWAHEATSAGSVDEALALLGERPFDLVLTDLHMPRRSGFELLDWVRERWADTAVVLFSSFPAPETRRQALEHGARSFLSKPFSLGALREVLESGAERQPPS